jgi:hypothetical protein
MRAAPVEETEQLGDQARFYTGICELFSLQIRRLTGGQVILIWWFIGAIEEEVHAKEDVGDKEIYAVEFCSDSDVLEKLTFQMDRNMVKKAIENSS